jgi:hypothetical protein
VGSTIITSTTAPPKNWKQVYEAAVGALADDENVREGVPICRRPHEPSSALNDAANALAALWKTPRPPAHKHK